MQSFRNCSALNPYCVVSIHLRDSVGSFIRIFYSADNTFFDDKNFIANLVVIA